MHREKVYIGLLLIKAFKGTGESSKEGRSICFVHPEKKYRRSYIVSLYYMIAFYHSKICDCKAFKVFISMCWL
jgi:hypothetical protein